MQSLFRYYNIILINMHSFMEHLHSDLYQRLIMAVIIGCSQLVVSVGLETPFLEIHYFEKEFEFFQTH